MAERDGQTPRDGRSQLGAADGGRGGAPSDLLRNPGGNPASGVKPRDFADQSRAQGYGSAPYSTADAARDGLIPVVVPPANRAGGVGSAGNGNKPFRLGGG